MTSLLIIAGLFVAALAWAVVRGVLTSLLAGEIKGALTAYLEKRVRNAAARLGSDLAAEHEGEWLAELSALQDRPLRAVLFVHGLARAARTIALDGGVPSEVAGDAEADVIPAAEPAAHLALPAVPVLEAAGSSAAALIDGLRARGMRVTPQRVVVHRALRELDRHVTADELLDAVNDRLPSVSLPTLYATLELLEELGLVRRVQRAGLSLFDPRLDHHHHLVCRSCGVVEDLDADVDFGPMVRAGDGGGFQTERVELVVHGRCAACIIPT